MKQFQIASKGNPTVSLLEERFKTRDLGKSVLLRLNDVELYNKQEVEINKLNNVFNAYDKVKFKSILQDYGIPTVPYYGSYKDCFPVCLLKGRHEIVGSDTYLIESVEDSRALRPLIKDGYFFENIINPTSQYTLYCTPLENFYAEKRYKPEDSDVIVSSKDYTVKPLIKGGSILFPKLWRDVQTACIKAVSLLRLQIAAVDVMYCAVKDNHRFYINKINLTPQFTNELVDAYINQIEKIVK